MLTNEKDLENVHLFRHKEILLTALNNFIQNEEMTRFKIPHILSKNLFQLCKTSTINELVSILSEFPYLRDHFIHENLSEIISTSNYNEDVITTFILTNMHTKQKSNYDSEAFTHHILQLEKEGKDPSLFI